MNIELFKLVIFNKFINSCIFSHLKNLDRDEKGYRQRETLRWNQLSIEFLLENNYLSLLKYWFNYYKDKVIEIEQIKQKRIDSSKQDSKSNAKVIPKKHFELEDYDDLLDCHVTLFKYGSIVPFLNKNRDKQLFNDVYEQYIHLFQLAKDSYRLPPSISRIDRVCVLAEVCLLGDLEMYELVVSKGFNRLESPMNALLNACFSGSLPLVKRIFTTFNHQFQQSELSHMIQYQEKPSGTRMKFNIRPEIYIYLFEAAKINITKDMFLALVSQNHYQLIEFIIDKHNSNCNKNTDWKVNIPLDEIFSKSVEEAIKKKYSTVWDVSLISSLEMFQVLVDNFTDDGTGNRYGYSVVLNTSKKYLIRYFCKFDVDGETGETIINEKSYSLFKRYFDMFRNDDYKYLNLEKYLLELKNITMLKRIISDFGGSMIYSYSKAFHYAIESNNTEAFSYLLEKQAEDFPMDIEQRMEQMISMVESGNLQILSMLSKMRYQPFSMELMNIAARCGQLHIVKFLNENRSEGCSTLALSWAIYARQSEELIDYLLIHCMKYLDLESLEPIRNACLVGNLSLVKKLLSFGFAINSTAMDFAASRNQLPIVQFLHYNRTEGCTTYAMNEAAMNGYLDIVKFLNENRTEGCTFSAMDGALQRGFMEITNYLHINRTEGCTSMGIDRALVNNQWASIRFLLENRTERWSPDGIGQAAVKGNFKLVRYAMSKQNNMNFDSVRHNCFYKRKTDEAIRFFYNLDLIDVTNINHEISTSNANNCDIDWRMFMLSLPNPAFKINDWDVLNSTNSSVINTPVTVSVKKFFKNIFKK